MEVVAELLPFWWPLEELEGRTDPLEVAEEDELELAEGADKGAALLAKALHALSLQGNEHLRCTQANTYGQSYGHSCLAPGKPAKCHFRSAVYT